MTEPKEKKKVEEFKLTDEMLTSVYGMNLSLPTLGFLVIFSAILFSIAMFVALPPILSLRVLIIVFVVLHIIIGVPLIIAGRAAGRVNQQFEAGHEGMEVLLKNLASLFKLFKFMYRFIFGLSIVALIAALVVDKPV